MPKNIFVLGLDAFGARLFSQIQGARDLRFHRLLPPGQAVHAEQYNIGELLRDAELELTAFPGTIDAIVTYWDFPASALAPVLRRRFGLPGPSLEAVLKCEHKYWSRLEQRQVAPECVPAFQVFDPFAEDPLKQVELSFPFWVKPIKSHSSQLGFLVRNRRAFEHVIRVIRQHIGRLGAPFDEILRHAELPSEVAKVGGYHCVAEAVISRGRQCTLEGYALGDDVIIYGIFDSVRHAAHRSSFARYEYPSALPGAIRARMIELTQRLVRHIGYNSAPFNIEMFYEHNRDQIWLLEINTRISRSHSPLFLLVDGASHQQVMVDVSLEKVPHLPHRAGSYRYACKHMMRVFEDGWVNNVPKQEEIAAVERSFPGALVEIHVEPGMHLLTDLLHQDSYSYELGVVFVGADSRTELRRRVRCCEEMLSLRVGANPTAVPRTPAIRARPNNSRRNGTES